MTEVNPDALVSALASVERYPDNGARRLFHGRGHCYPGLAHVNVDLLPPVILITLYQAPDSAALELWIDAARQVAGVDGVLLQRRDLPGAPAEVAWGAVPDSLVVNEQGLRFEVRLGRNQNSGFFLDMAAGRQWVREHARQRRVLNLFAYTCAFSVAALAGGADEVVNLDMSRSALAQGRNNHRLNQQDLSRVRFLGHELFRSFGKLRKTGPYDLVIVDPPSFQPGSFAVQKDYPRLMGRLAELVAAGGEVLLCLNDPGRDSAFLQQAMAAHAPQFEFLERIANPASFPEQYPERGLKVLRFRRLTG